jgi:hypothetical protein
MTPLPQHRCRECCLIAALRVRIALCASGKEISTAIQEAAECAESAGDVAPHVGASAPAQSFTTHLLLKHGTARVRLVGSMIHACSSSCRPRRWRKPRSTAFSPQTDCRVVGESGVRDAAEAARQVSANSVEQIVTIADCGFRLGGKGRSAARTRRQRSRFLPSTLMTACGPAAA